MSNPVFYAADMSGAVFTASLAADAVYPLDNLHTNVPALPWKSSALTNGQTLNIDLGSAWACDFVALGAHNLLSMGNVKLQVGTIDNGAFATPIDVAVLNGLAVSPGVVTFASVTKRYWRILFTDTNYVTPQIGLLLLGSKFATPFPYDSDSAIGNKQFSTSSKLDMYGTIRTSRQIPGRERMEVTFTLVDDATVTAFLAFMNIVQGQWNPFFFVDHKGTLHIMHFEEDYIEAKSVRYNINDIARLKMRHQNAG